MSVSESDLPLPGIRPEFFRGLAALLEDVPESAQLRETEFDSSQNGESVYVVLLFRVSSTEGQRSVESISELAHEGSLEYIGMKGGAETEMTIDGVVTRFEFEHIDGPDPN